MDELRKKKQQELQQMMQVKPPFSLEPSEHQQTDSEYFSDKVAQQQPQRRTKLERSKEKETPVVKVSSPPKILEDLEKLKQKKIEEIKNMLIKERATTAGIQPFKASDEAQKVENKKYDSREGPSKSTAGTARGH